MGQKAVEVILMRPEPRESGPHYDRWSYEIGVEGEYHAGGAFLALGFFGTPLMLWLTRARPGQVLADERDESIGRRAANGGLIAVLLYVFALSIVLWERHEASGCVPVGWLWFLAYSSAALAYLVPALVSLLLDFGILDRGEG